MPDLIGDVALAYPVIPDRLVVILQVMTQLVLLMVLSRCDFVRSDRSLPLAA